MIFYTILVSTHLFLAIYTLFSYIPLLWRSNLFSFEIFFILLYFVFLCSFFISLTLIRSRKNATVHSNSTMRSKSIIFRLYGALFVFFILFTSLLILVDLFSFCVFTLSFSIQKIFYLLSYIPFIKLYIIPTVSLILLLWGYINHFWVRVIKYKFKINEAGDYSNLKIAVLSDLHLGQLHSYSSLSRWVKKTNELEPDLVLILGDIINYSLDSLDVRVKDVFKTIKAPLGVYSILGNHDLLKENEEILIDYFKDCNVKLLIDEVLVINGNINLIGRNDQKSKKKVMFLNDLFKNVDSKNLTIFMNHRPLKSYKKVIKDYNWLDVILSGHTHGGQFFPMTIFNHFSYKINKGYKKIGKTNCYVSQGIGTNNFFPYRIGTKPEILLLTFK